MDNDPESRRLEETISELRDKLHLSDLRIEFLEKELASKCDELNVQKSATTTMWTFIHRRHRLDVPAASGSIREVLQRLDRQ